MCLSMFVFSRRVTPWPYFVRTMLLRAFFIRSMLNYSPEVTKSFYDFFASRLAVFFFLRRQYWPVQYRSKIHNHITDLFILDPCNIGVSVHINPYASPETGVNCVRRLFWIHRDEYVGSMIGVYTVYRLTKSFQITDVTFQFIFNISMYRHGNFVSTTRLYQLSAFLTSGFYCILITTYTIIYLILLIIMNIVTRFLNIYSEIAISFIRFIIIFYILKRKLLETN